MSGIFKMKFIYREMPGQVSASVEGAKVTYEFASDQTKNKEKEPTSTDWQKKIDSIITEIKEGNEVTEEVQGEERVPRETEIVKSISNIPTSEFLKRSTEDLNTLFLQNGKVNFHGHEGAKWKIGMGDLFPASQKFIKVNGKVGKRSISGNGKVGYLDKGGNYLPVYGGEKIEMDILEVEQTGFDQIKTLSLNEEKMGKTAFLERIEQEEKNAKEMKEAYKKFLKERGIDPKEVKEGTFFEVATILSKEIEARYGIPWEVTLAQSTLESGNGKHAPGNNFFGIKGRGQEFLTTEYIGGSMVKMKDSFRRYDSIVDSFTDYAELISGAARYRAAFQYKDNPRMFLQTVINAGYATDPRYVEKAENVLTSRGLSLDRGFLA